MVITGEQEQKRLEELRDAAIAAVMRGWAVIPGTTFGDDGCWHGRDGAIRLGPVSDTWAGETITEWPEAHRVWGRRPLGLLLACTDTVHAVEIRAKLGEQIRDLLAEADLLGPVVRVPPARWVLLAEPGPPDLAARPLDRLARRRVPVTYRVPGQWVPLPPTATGPRRATWEVPPDPRRLPPAPHVLQLIADLKTG